MRMKFWKKLSAAKRTEQIRAALAQNVDFSTDPALGYPVSQLDGRIFPKEVPFLDDAPSLQVFVANPNHIGCHTYGASESVFKGTQELERMVLNIVAADILKAEDNGFDGYIASGGTEANIQAIWIYRNHFINQYNARPDQIAIVASEDTHYSIPKAGNLLGLDWLRIPVDPDTRAMQSAELERIVSKAVCEGKKYLIAVSNMGTTMFGSVDDPSIFSSVFERLGLAFKMHIDGAYGGFVYPFSNPESTINFQDPNISSFTIDAHKMLQAPYGTGIFICRKGLIQNTLTKEAEYVEGLDLTLCGSRSGSNAVAVWMILHAYGPHGWFEKISILQMRTTWLCRRLDECDISFFRDPFMNIVTIRAEHIPDQVAKKFGLVPQTHGSGNKWFKVVIMEHVEVEQLSALVDEISRAKANIPA